MSGEEQKTNSPGNFHVPWDLTLRTECSHVIRFSGYPTLYLALCYMLWWTDGLTA